MTKEEEAIEYIQKQIDYYKEQIKFIEAVDSDYYDEEYELYKNRIKQFETVLNMLKEKDKQIAKYEKIYKEYDCYRWVKELEKKDKIIDLMADFMYKTGTGRRALSCMFRQNDECNENGCKYCIKKYFDLKGRNNERRTNN